MSQVLLPTSLNSLWEIMDEKKDFFVFAGGTDLFVKLRENKKRPQYLIGLERIEELKGVTEAESEISIGSCATHASLIDNSAIQQAFPVLVKALEVIGSPAIRNMGTIGGNICTASPAGDTLPPLYILDAEVQIQSKNNSRRIPVNQFIAGPGEIRLQKNEILSSIWLKKCPHYDLHFFRKIGQRNALAISVVSLAAVFQIDEQNTVNKARLAWGSTGPTVISSNRVEKALEGKRLSLELINGIKPMVYEVVNPIDDIRATAAYRRDVSANLLLRLLEEKVN